MWLFDRILVNRIRDLERTVEILTGANSVLSQELEKAQHNEAHLLEKIFNITGVNRFSNNGHQEQTKSSDPIRLTNRPKSWPELRQNLETQSKIQYWENKKAQEAIDKKEKRVASPEEIDKLEKDTIGD